MDRPFVLVPSRHKLLPRIATNGNIDDSSKKGKFGWVKIDGINLPYILRNEVKYLSVRMVEKQLINKYIRMLSTHVYSSNRIKAYFITEWEYILFNEINYKHSGGAFGRKRFTQTDLITELEDTKNFYEFIQFCYLKVTTVHITLKSNCGFIQMGPKIVPYINIGGHKFVPTLFFDGISASLKSKCVYIDSWDWAYLRFHCKIIGVKHDDIPKKSCSVINLIDIQPILQDKEEVQVVNTSVVKDNNFLIISHNEETIPWYVI